MLYRQDPNATMIPTTKTVTGISVGSLFVVGHGRRGASASG